jgi:hypothetical protein
MQKKALYSRALERLLPGVRPHVAMEGICPLERFVAALPGTAERPLIAVNLLVGNQSLTKSKAFPTALIGANMSTLVFLDVPAHERLAAEVHPTAVKGASVRPNASVKGRGYEQTAPVESIDQCHQGQWIAHSGRACQTESQSWNTVIDSSLRNMCTLPVYNSNQRWNSMCMPVTKSAESSQDQIAVQTCLFLNLRFTRKVWQNFTSETN